MTKEMVMSPKPDLGRCLRQYRDNMSEDLLALWKIWLPSTILNFAFMPMWARIPWVAGTSLLWTTILSAMRGGDIAHVEDMAGGAVTGINFQLLKEELEERWTCPVEMDPDLSHFCLSASGPDKVGWVAAVARAVAEGGGNVTHSKMMRMGHEFTILMHVSVQPEERLGLMRALKTNDSLRPLGISTSSLTRRLTGRYDVPTMGLHIHCVGEDRPGILAIISERVSKLGISVDNISTELRHNKDGRRDFVVNAECTSAFVTIHSNDKLNEVVEDMNDLKSTLGLDVLDIRVHPTPKKGQ